jgi:formiminoglutamate deiminase
MAEALRQAAAEAGIRLTLLDTCYLAGGLGSGGHLPLDEVQLRFSDGDLTSWQARVKALAPSEGMRVGAAIHSVRAVPREYLKGVRDLATDEPGEGWPLHLHLSEQPAENDACLAYYGMTPAELLAAEGVLSARTTAVHATHLSGHDIALLGDSRTTACFCPTTEQDLADGIGPARALRDAGCPLSLGSDQHATIDLLGEARAMEAHERLASRHRGRFTPADLMQAMTGHACIGWPDAGRIEVGQRADLVAVRTDSPRTAGSAPGQLMLCATAADVHTVVIDGDFVVQDGRHRLGDVGALLHSAITPLWSAA